MLAILLTLCQAESLAPPAQNTCAYALLVGVSDYEHLTDDLLGPANDVRIIERTLVERLGFTPASITRLTTDTEEPSARPTRRNILGALDALAVHDLEGCFVVVHFSGHGLQLPDDDGDEVDGLDEALLACDVGPWDETTATLPGAIRDDEFALGLAKLLEKGATVWWLADTCFSGTLHRGTLHRDTLYRGMGGVRYRELSSGQLRVPAAPPMPRENVRAGGFADDVLARAVDERRFIAFSGARQNERASELALPDPFDTEVDRSFGVFTHALVSELVCGSRISSFEDLIRRIELRYEAGNKCDARPSAVGRLATTIPGFMPREFDPTVVRRGAELQLDRGALHGIVAGTRFCATGKHGAPHDIVVDVVRAFDSLCKLTSPGQRLITAFDAYVPAPATLLAEPSAGRALPIFVPTECTRARAALAPHLSEPWVRLVSSVDAAEWTLVDEDDALLLTRSSDSTRAYRVEPATLRADLKRVYAVRNLEHMALHPWVGTLPPGLTVELYAEPAGCDAYAVGPIRQPEPGSSAYLQVQNRSGDEWQINAYVIDPDLAIEALGSWAVPHRASQRLGDKLFFFDEDCGPASVLLIATRRSTASIANDGLVWLDQSALVPFRGRPDVRVPRFMEEEEREIAREITRSGRKSPLGDLLEALVEPTRSSESASYEDLEAFVTLLPFALAWPVPHVARLLDGFEVPDPAALAKAFAWSDLPIAPTPGDRAQWLTEGVESGALLLLGSERARTWAYDPDGAERVRATSASELVDALASGAFRPRFVFSELPSGWLSVYDIGDAGPRWDLLLLDEDRDLTAERRWDGRGDGWSTAIEDARTPLVMINERLFSGGDAAIASIKTLRATLFQAPGTAPARPTRHGIVSAPPTEGQVVQAAPRAQFSQARLERMVTELVGKRVLHPSYVGRIRSYYDKRPIVNAMAGRADGGVPALMVFAGLVDVFENEERLIRAVVAHELAHLVLGHADASRRPGAPFQSAADLEHHFTRQQEFEADTLACELLASCGYPPLDLADALLALYVHERRSSVGWFAGLIGTHSSPIHRIARLDPKPDRFDALRHFELGLGFIECRRPRHALLAFEEALALEPMLDEARFDAARAALQIYYDELPLEVRETWLRPDFGPLLTLDDVFAARGAVMTDQDRDRYERAKTRIEGLPRHGFPVVRSLLTGTLEVLEPDCDRATVLRGVARLQGALLAPRLARGGDARLRLRFANNAALGLHRLGLGEESWAVVGAELDEDPLAAGDVVLHNAARLAASDVVDACSGVVLEAFYHLATTSRFGARRASDARAALERLTSADTKWIAPATEPSLLQLCRPTEVVLATARIGLLAPLGVDVAGLGLATRDQPVHPDYESLRVRTWADDERGPGLVVLVEDERVLKLTSYVVGSAVRLRPQDEADPRELRIAVGMPFEEFLTVTLATDLTSSTPILAHHLGRSGFGLPTGELEEWRYFPGFDLAVLVEEDRIAGVAVTPASLR